MKKSGHQELLRGSSTEIRATVKKLADRTMGAGGRPADLRAGKELVALVTAAERAGDRRVIDALATKDLQDILLFAAEGGHVDFVKALLRAGVKPNLTLMAGLRPINSAAGAGRADVIELLVRAGEDPSYAGFFERPVAIEAAEKGHLEAVRKLVELGADVNAKVRTGGTTLLIAIAGKADAELIRLIAENGGDVNETNDEGRTPLMLAAEAGNLEAVQELIRRNANVNAASRLRRIEEIQAQGRDLPGFHDKRLRRLRESFKDPLETALILAADGGHTEIVEVLLKAGAEPHARDVNGQTALDRAKDQGYAKITHLLQTGKSVGSPKLGGSDLLSAAAGGNLRAVRAAIQAGVDVNLRGKVHYEGDLEEGYEPKGGKPALVLAAERGDLAMLKELLAAGADPNLCAEKTLFNNGQNALHAAAEKGHVALVKVLLAGGAKVNAKEIGRKDIPARTALQIAAENKHKAVVEALLAADQKPGKNPPAGLHEAVENGDLVLVRRLLAAGAEVNKLATGTRWSPLMMACFMGYTDVTAALLDAGADMNLRNRMGQTALTVAVHGATMSPDIRPQERATRNHQKTIKLLLDRGADVNVDTWRGETPLDMARGAQLRPIAALLKKAGGNNSAELQD